MPRELRPRVGDLPYHVTWRGVRRTPLFLDSRDAQRFLALLGDTAKKREWRCHAYCLMPNHVHLVLTTPSFDLSDGMQRLGSLYAAAFNRRYGYEGHAFERRFWSSVVDRDGYLLELIRYICLNPVRAGLCELPEEWRWSSYAATVAAVDGAALKGIDDMRKLFRADNVARRFIDDGLSRHVRTGRVPGSDPGTVSRAGTGASANRGV
jgi:putative transposase